MTPEDRLLGPLMDELAASGLSEGARQAIHFSLFVAAGLGQGLSEKLPASERAVGMTIYHRILGAMVAAVDSTYRSQAQ